MRPIVGYYGGKQRLAKRICDLIPKHTVYCEPFAGGAAVFFKKPWPKVSNTHHYREVLNDTSEELINLYRVFQDKKKAEELIHRLQFTLYSRSEHNKAMKETGGSDVDRAWRYYRRYKHVVWLLLAKRLGNNGFWQEFRSDMGIQSAEVK